MDSHRDGIWERIALLFGLSQCALGWERGERYFYKVMYSIPRCSQSREPSMPTGPQPIIATFLLNTDLLISPY